MDSVIEIIKDFGFPVACVIFLAWYVYTTNKQSREDTNARENNYISQINKFNDTLNNFNTTLTTIDTRLGCIEKRMDQGADK